MTKKLLVTLEIEVKELPEDEKDELRDSLCLNEQSEDDDDSYFSPDCYAPAELGDVLAGGLYDDAVREMFAGSNVYVTFGNAELVSAEWTSV